MALLDGCDYDEVDLDALRRSVAMMRAESAVRREQVDELLAIEPWVEVATFAAYHCQKKNLDLPPWQEPPATCDDDDAEASALLDRMLEHGVSQWEPDPLRALAKAEDR